MCPSAGGTWETLPVGFREFLSADSVFELKFEKWFGVCLVVSCVGDGEGKSFWVEQMWMAERWERPWCFQRTCSNSVAVESALCEKIRFYLVQVGALQTDRRWWVACSDFYVRKVLLWAVRGWRRAGVRLEMKAVSGEWLALERKSRFAVLEAVGELQWVEVWSKLEVVKGRNAGDGKWQLEGEVLNQGLKNFFLSNKLHLKKFRIERLEDPKKCK